MTIPQPAQLKRISTLTARAALLGLVLELLHDGTCVLTGEACSPRVIPTLQAAEAVVYGLELLRKEMLALSA